MWVGNKSIGYGSEKANKLVRVVEGGSLAGEKAGQEDGSIKTILVEEFLYFLCK